LDHYTCLAFRKGEKPTGKRQLEDWVSKKTYQKRLRGNRDWCGTGGGDIIPLVQRGAAFRGVDEELRTVNLAWGSRRSLGDERESPEEAPREQKKGGPEKARKR